MLNYFKTQRAGTPYMPILQKYVFDSEFAPELLLAEVAVDW